MQNQTKQILNDIYRIDATLKEHEQSLIKIVDELILAKPYIKVDETFVKQLRGKLEARIGESRQSVLGSIFPLKRYAYAFGALLVAALATVSFFYLNQGSPEQIVLNTGINNVGERAFGEISFSPSDSTAKQAADSEEVLGLGGGGGIPYPTAPSVPSIEDMKGEIYRYEATNYNYVYAGEEFSVQESTMPVYKKSSSEAVSSKLAGILGKVSLDIIDISKFRSAKIGSLQITEDRDYGYSLFIDPTNNSISISMNWERWPQDIYSKTLTESDALSEEQVLSIAENFVKEYGIDKSPYGSPEVSQANPILYMESTPDGSTVSRPYYQENYSVVYPLSLNGLQVYDQSGNKIGMNVEVSARYKKVTYASNIVVAGFESSNYEVETSLDKILSSAEAGGINSPYFYDNPTKTVDVKISTPVLGLTSVWQTTENKYMGEELYVPAYIFPITENPDTSYYYKKSVVVPLVGIQQSGPIIRPMMEPGVMMDEAEE